MAFIQQMLLESFSRNAGNTALEYGGKTVLYRELDEASTGVARAIAARYPGEIVTVGVCMADRADVITAIVGILKARCLFVPIDHTLPGLRVAAMAGTARASLLITDAAGRETFAALADFPAAVLTLEDLCGRDAPAAATPGYREEDHIYVYFTSGSTGEPKAIVGVNRSLAHFIGWETELLGIDAATRVSQFVNPGFDAFLRDLFVPLCAGGTLCVPPPRETLAPPQDLAAWIDQQRINLVHCVPSFFKLINTPDLRATQFEHLRYVLLSGERILPAGLKPWYDTFGDKVQLFNLYGATETTLIKTYYPIQPADAGRSAIPIGKPIKGAQVFIFDEHLQPAGKNMAGELYVRTPYRSAGYLNDPALTAQKFIKNPYGNDPTDLLYRTGDLGRLLPDGNIELIGRIDRQVKIRGIRVEPGETETRLLQNPLVREAVVQAVADPDGEQCLCAYVVLQPAAAPPDLRAYLAGLLPDYLVPAHFTVLDRIPLTANGKTDFRALPAPEAGKDEAYAAPATDTEKRLAALWAEVLKCGDRAIGRSANFFEMGGHSLRATILANRVQKEFAVGLPLVTIFANPVLSAQAACVDAAAPAPCVPIAQTKDRPFYPMSSAQKRLYFLQQLDPASTAYNITTTLEVEGDLDVTHLQTVFDGLIERHGSLRTCFQTVAGTPRQVVQRKVPFRIAFFDDPAVDPQTRIKQFIQPFNLQTAPLLRVGILKTGPGRHILVLDLHHTIADGTSLGVLVRDILGLYAGEALPPVPVRYTDYSEWHNQQKQSGLLWEQEQFWKATFAGEIPALSLPADQGRPPRQQLEGASVHFPVSRENLDALKGIARREGTTLYCVLLTAYLLLLKKVTNQNDLVIGTIVGGRRHPDLLETVGMFANTLALKFTVDPGMTLHELLRYVKAQTLQAFEHQDYQYEDLVEQVVQRRDASRNPLFDAMFNLQNMDIPEIKLPGLHFRRFDFEKHISKFDLTLRGIEEAGGFEFTFEYATRLFAGGTVDRFIAYLDQVIAALIRTPGQRVNTLDVLPAGESRRLVRQLNRTERPFPQDCTMDALFEAQAARTPLAVALEWEDQTIDYRTLDGRANQLAWFLRRNGVGENTVVALMLERSPEAVTAMLAVLKAGGAFLPVDADYPLARQRHLLADSGAAVLITSTTLCGEPEELLAGTGVTLLLHADAADRWRGEDTAKPGPARNAGALAYLIYTSGTTGTPKGVMISHRALVNYIHWAARQYAGEAAADFPLFTSLSFDLTLTALFVPLTTGGRIVIYRRPLEDALLLEKVLRDDKADVIKLTPSHLRLMAALPERAARLRRIIVGGEALPAGLAATIYQRYGGNVTLYNEYGPTETTVGCVVHTYRPDDPYGTVPIGVPVANTRAYLLDAHQQLVPYGTTGELYVGGAQVGLGYWGRDELTGRRFVPDPFAPGEKLYRTGDLARWLPGEVLMYVGRADEQVKIRGYRVEPGEIESRLLAHPAVTAAVVTVQTSEAGDKYLVAHYATGGPAEPGELRAFLSASLPGYMVPAHFVRVPEMPLTPNGKVDKQALPPLPLPEADAVEPDENPAVTRLKRIWTEVLGGATGPINAGSDFFGLGGHSLAAITLIAKIHKEFNVLLPIGQVFDAPSFGQQLEGIGARENATSPAPTPGEETFVAIAPAPAGAHYPLSSAQRRLYVLHQMAPQSTAYNIPVFFKVKGALDLLRLESAVRDVTGRHEALRTVFGVVGDEPVQYVREPSEFGVSVYAGIPADEAIGQFVRPFDLQKAPLLRIGVLQTEPGEHLLMFDTHHIVCDEVSSSLLVREFTALYTQKVLPPPRLQYKDFAVWQNSPRQRQSMAAQEGFWLEQLGGEIPKLSLPADFTRPSLKSFSGDTVSFTLPAEQVSRLKRLARQEEATPYMVLLSIYSILLARLCNQEDILTGTVTAGRRHADLQDVYGVFVNTIVLRTFPKGDLPYRAFLKEVKTRTLACFENQDYQYEDLVEKRGVERDTSRNPLFEVMFNMHNVEMSPWEIPGLQFSPYAHHAATAKFDLNLQVVAAGEAMTLNLTYATALFRRSTVERFAAYFRELTASVLDDPRRAIADLEVVPAPERFRILRTFNDTRCDYAAHKTIHQLFEEQAARTPGAVALTTGSEAVSYEILNRRANQLAGVLVEKGVAPGTFVAVTIDRLPEMVVAVMGILKAGGAYVPLEPHLPAGRIAALAQSLNVPVILTNQAQLEKVSGIAADTPTVAHVVCLDELDDLGGDGAAVPPGAAWQLLTRRDLEAQPAGNPGARARAEDLAYVIFTSGSTGTPKGVAVQHKPVINLIEWVNRSFGVGPGDTLLFVTSLGFDLSVYDIFGVLAAGGAVRIATADEARDPQALLGILSRERITCWDSAPAALQQLVPFLPAGAVPQAPLRLVLLSGDWIPLPLPDAVRRAFTQARVIALGGATEATVWSNFFPVQETDPAWRSIPYGKPIQNAAYYILDGNRNVCPIGVKGDLYIGGLCLAAAYINDEALTRRKFVDNPFVPGEKMYYTGDKARWFDDGNVEFLGREDAQVKVRGYRIELGEPEHQLLKHPAITEAKVLAKARPDGENYLCAYYVAGRALSARELRQYLSGQLPEYMIPAYFVAVARMPTTANGKLAVNELPDPAGEELTAYIAPQDETESVLAGIWAQLLSLQKDEISTDADFFRLGGHSLRATLMLARVNELLQVRVPLAEVFRQPTIGDLAGYIRQAPRVASAVIGPAPEKEYYALSPAQKRLFALHHLTEGSTAYNMPVAFALEGAVDVPKLERTFAAILRRHESLRTAFGVQDGEPVQFVQPEPNFRLEVQRAGDKSLPDLVRRFVRPFALENAPLFRVGLAEIGPDRYVLMLDMHHIVSDGFSVDIIAREFMQLYGGAVLPPPALQYKDYTEWQQSGETTARQALYWREQFHRPAPALELPLDYPRKDHPDYEGAAAYFTLSAETTRKLRLLAEREGATEFVVLLAALNALLARISGQDDIVVGSPVAGRRQAELGPVVGLFVNVLPLRNGPAGGKTFRQLLREVKHNTLAALEHQEHPFDALVEAVLPRRDWSRNPLFDVYFYLDNLGIVDLQLPGLHISPCPIPRTTTQYELMLGMAGNGPELSGVLTYATALFKQSTIERLAGYFTHLLETVADNPAVVLSDLRLSVAAPDYDVFTQMN